MRSEASATIGWLGSSCSSRRRGLHAQRAVELSQLLLQALGLSGVLLPVRGGRAGEFVVQQAQAVRAEYAAG
jgi:hypothetical protein